MLSIIILERGINTRHDPVVTTPCSFFENLSPDSQRAKFYSSEPAKELAGRQIIVPTGGCLGGGSSINFMVYARPQSIDFDDWKTEGWHGNDMLPYLKKVLKLHASFIYRIFILNHFAKRTQYECFQATDPGIDPSVHGYDGEFCVSAGTHAQAKFQNDFFQACAEVGIPHTADPQDLKTSNSVGVCSLIC